MDHGCLLISRKEVSSLLLLDECMNAVEAAFKAYAEGAVPPPKILGTHAQNGGFHIKAGMMNIRKNYFVAKMNANFPGNAGAGMPTIQGVIIICDADNGRVLAITDSIEITIARTGAATGVAAKYLARQNSNSVLIIGCGNQGRVSLRALSRVRHIETAYAFDIDQAASTRFQIEMSAELKLKVVAVSDVQPALAKSDICITCTPSRKPLFKKSDVRPGTFIAAVGADSEEKQEIDPSLIASCKVVADMAAQSATIGDFHHAIEQGLVTASHLHAELGEIIAGRKKGRESDEEIIVFDSTGMALQDVAAASIVYERALTRSDVSKFDFGKL